MLAIQTFLQLGILWVLSSSIKVVHSLVPEIFSARQGASSASPAIDAARYDREAGNHNRLPNFVGPGSTQQTESTTMANRPVSEDVWEDNSSEHLRVNLPDDLYVPHDVTLDEPDKRHYLDMSYYDARHASYEAANVRHKEAISPHEPFPSMLLPSVDINHHDPLHLSLIDSWNKPQLTKNKEAKLDPGRTPSTRDIWQPVTSEVPAGAGTRAWSFENPQATWTSSPNNFQTIQRSHVMSPSVQNSSVKPMGKYENYQRFATQKQSEQETMPNPTASTMTAGSSSSPNIHSAREKGGTSVGSYSKTPSTKLDSQKFGSQYSKEFPEVQQPPVLHYWQLYPTQNVNFGFWPHPNTMQWPGFSSNYQVYAHPGVPGVNPGHFRPACYRPPKRRPKRVIPPHYSTSTRASRILSDDKKKSQLIDKKNKKSYSLKSSDFPHLPTRPDKDERREDLVDDSKPREKKLPETDTTAKENEPADERAPRVVSESADSTISSSGDDDHSNPPRSAEYLSPPQASLIRVDRNRNKFQDIEEMYTVHSSNPKKKLPEPTLSPEPEQLRYTPQVPKVLKSDQISPLRKQKGLEYPNQKNVIKKSQEIESRIPDYPSTSDKAKEVSGEQVGMHTNPATEKNKKLEQNIGLQEFLEKNRAQESRNKIDESSESVDPSKNSEGETIDETDLPGSGSAIGKKAKYVKSKMRFGKSRADRYQNSDDETVSQRKEAKERRKKERLEASLRKQNVEIEDLELLKKKEKNVTPSESSQVDTPSPKPFQQFRPEQATKPQTEILERELQRQSVPLGWATMTRKGEEDSSRQNTPTETEPTDEIGQVGQKEQPKTAGIVVQVLKSLVGKSNNENSNLGNLATENIEQVTIAQQHTVLVDKFTHYKPQYDTDYDRQAEELRNAFEEMKRNIPPTQTTQNPKTTHQSLMAPLKIKALSKKFEDCFTPVYNGNLNPNKSVFKDTRSTLTKYEGDGNARIWGEETVAAWRSQHFDIQLMNLLAFDLKLNDKNVHVDISMELLPFGYDELKKIATGDKNKIRQMELSIKKSLGEAEGSRRLAAYRQALHHQTIERNWNTYQSFKAYGAKEKRIIEARYGLTRTHYFLPDVISHNNYPILKSEPSEPGEIYEMLYKVLGEKEVKRRWELLKYVHSRVYTRKWWHNLDLPKASTLFGVDALTILKIGDALQFGSPFLLTDAPGRIPIDHAYAELLQIMNKSEGFPWIESPERNWLYKVCGRLYQDRLREISNIVLSRISSRANLVTKQRISGLTEEPFPEYMVGSALIWCDLGLDIKELANLFKVRNFKMNKSIFAETYNDLELEKYQTLAISAWLRSFNFAYYRPPKTLTRLQEFRRLLLMAKETYFPLKIHFKF